MYTLFVRLDVHPDKLDDFVEAIMTNAAASLRDEPGCLAFDVHQDIETPTRFYLYEIYVDEDAFRIDHRGAPHYARWQEAAKVCIVDGSHKNIFARPISLGSSTRRAAPLELVGLSPVAEGQSDVGDHVFLPADEAAVANLHQNRSHIKVVPLRRRLGVAQK